VAEAALDAGAAAVNDVSGLRLDPRMAEVVASRQAGLVLVHSRGAVAEMATAVPAYPGGVLAAVIEELSAALDRARAAGVQSERIVVDPGLGFGKTTEQNFELLRGLATLRVLGRPILVGPSRKRFLGRVTGREVAERDAATASACAIAWESGARLFRVHEPALTRDALAVAHALRPR
jgi:dihydropteroate synthase